MLKILLLMMMTCKCYVCKVGWRILIIFFDGQCRLLKFVYCKLYLNKEIDNIKLNGFEKLGVLFMIYPF